MLALFLLSTCSVDVRAATVPTTNATDALLGFRARQQDFRAQLLTSAPSLDLLGLFVQENITFNVEVIQNVLDAIYYEEAVDLYNSNEALTHIGENPDFRLGG